MMMIGDNDKNMRNSHNKGAALTSTTTTVEGQTNCNIGVLKHPYQTISESPIIYSDTTVTTDCNDDNDDNDHDRW